MEPRPKLPHPRTGEPVIPPDLNLAGIVQGDVPEWGFYDASGLYRLIGWLKAGAVASEAELLDVLTKCDPACPSVVFQV